MKRQLLVLVSISTLALSFDLGSLINSAQEAIEPTKTEKESTSFSSLSTNTISKGLKEALNNGVAYAVKELGKDNGYLNNSLVKIPLPENLAKAETLIRKAGGDKIADDLINAMNRAATTAAPKTAQIFSKAIADMNLEDAKKILAGDDKAATNYFKTHTSDSLSKTITPIVQTSMEENSVAKYYKIFNNAYKTYGKGLVDNSGVIGYAKSLGVDSYLPSSSDEELDGYVTNKAIDGLFTMIAQKETEIREDPIAQTSSILKQVFGN
jgi:deoxyhypusine synthase